MAHWQNKNKIVLFDQTEFHKHISGVVDREMRPLAPILAFSNHTRGIHREVSDGPHRGWEEL